MLEEIESEFKMKRKGVERDIDEGRLIHLLFSWGGGGGGRQWEPY